MRSQTTSSSYSFFIFVSSKAKFHSSSSKLFFMSNIVPSNVYTQSCKPAFLLSKVALWGGISSCSFCASSKNLLTNVIYSSKKMLTSLDVSMMRQSLLVPSSLCWSSLWKKRTIVTSTWARCWSFGPCHLFLVTFKSIVRPIHFMPFPFYQPTS